MNQLYGTAANTPMFMADPTEARFVVMANRLDSPDFSCALQVSGDKGVSWISASPVPKLPEGAEKCYGPEVAFDRRGRLYYLFVGLAGQGNRPMGVFLTTSSDRAKTFTEPVRVLGPLNFGVRMAVEQKGSHTGRMHLVWIETTSEVRSGAFGTPPNPVMTAHSDDAGHNFSKPVQVSDPRRERVVSPALYLAGDDRVHIAYYDLKDDQRDYHNLAGPIWNDTWALVVASSDDGGATFRQRVATDDIVPADRPMLILTMPPAGLVAEGDKVCVAWTDARYGDPDALFACGDRDRDSWKPIIRLNDDAKGNGVSQYLPRLGLSPRGRIDALFYDRRDDPENIHNSTYLATSVDKGSSFSGNIKVSSAPSDTMLGPQYIGPAADGQWEIGSRLGVLSRSDDVLLGWADTRNSQRLRDQGYDVFVNSVSNLPEPRSISMLMQAAGAVLFLLGLGIALWHRRGSTDSQPDPIVEPDPTVEPK